MHGMEPTTTAPLTLDTLPDGCRIWIFAANRAFAADEQTGLDALMTKVIGKWSIKQPGMRGCHAFAEDRFLVVGAEEHRMMLDGCSVDAMMSFVMRLEAETGMKLVDRMVIHYRDASGAVQSVSRMDFAALVKSGAANAETHVFDTTVSRIEDLRAGKFETPVKSTWLASAFLS
jgi:hypothetical protein